MNRIYEVFGVPRVLLPVIHPIGLEAGLDSVGIAHAAGVKGVFLIDQGLPEEEVLHLVLSVRERYPALWVGVNLLSKRPAEALRVALAACQGRVDGIWTDSIDIDPDAARQPVAQAFLEARRERGWTGLCFGGVAFKYQRPVPDAALGRAAVAAERFVDVVCTSGPGTGAAAQIDKVRRMREALGPEVALALASGVTADNVGGYLPYVDAFLVGTGIEREFGVLDARKLAALQALIVGSYGSWLPALALHTEPLGKEPRLPSGDWRQDARYPAPLWAATAAELARRVSIENVHRLYALELLGHQPGERCAKLLELAGWSQLRRYRIGQIEAADPIAEGFMRRLRLWVTDDAPEQPVPPPALARAFFAAEEARVGNMERWLVARYGERAPEGEIFDWIDYPAFDNGVMGLSFAALIHGPEIHLWSRVHHAHK